MKGFYYKGSKSIFLDANLNMYLLFCFVYKYNLRTMIFFLQKPCQDNDYRLTRSIVHLQNKYSYLKLKWNPSGAAQI